MFKEYIAYNQMTGTIYAIAALVLFIVDRPFAAATMLVCSETASICVAIYRTASKP